MHKDKLDEIDIFILETLQREGRKKRKDIADSVGLSLPSVSERFQKLEDLGYISGYFAKIDPLKAGLDVTAFVFVTAESSQYFLEITRLAVEEKRVLECHSITGIGSHLLKIRVINMRELENLLNAIQSWPGVKNTTTDIVLSTAKETTFLPVDHLHREEV